MEYEEIIMKNKLKQIEDIIDTADYCMRSFLWSGDNGNRYMRNRRAKDFNCPEVTWVEGGDEYSAEYTFSQSRKHTYAKGYYYKNGNRTTLTAIKNSYKRLCQQYGDTDTDDKN